MDSLAQLQRMEVDFIKDFEEISSFCRRNKTTTPTLIRLYGMLFSRPGLALHQSGLDKCAKTVGPLFNMLACRLNIEPEESLGQILDHVQRGPSVTPSPSRGSSGFESTLEGNSVMF